MTAVAENHNEVFVQYLKPGFGASGMMDLETSSTIAKRPADPPKLAEAWDQFYEHCFAIIQQCPGVRQLNGVDREDCVQEVMMEIVRRFGDRQPESIREELTGWIRVVSRNKAADIARRRVRKPEVFFDDGAGADLLDGLAEAQEFESSDGDAVSLVWEALISLDQEVPVTSYLIFYLRTIEAWSILDIADLFQISPEQARARCHRVKKKFGMLIKDGADQQDSA
jgi:RNA polymerase sigma factor (sigma-70 family)